MTIIYPPYKVACQGKVTIACGLTRRGTVSNLVVTAGGQLRVHVLNATDKTIQLIPKTILVNVLGSDIKVQHFAEGIKGVAAAGCPEVTGDTIRSEVMDRFPDVGDLSQHPVKEPMRKLIVRSTEVQWVPPP